MGFTSPPQRLDTTHMFSRQTWPATAGAALLSAVFLVAQSSATPSGAAAASTSAVAIDSAPEVGHVIGVTKPSPALLRSPTVARRHADHLLGGLAEISSTPQLHNTLGTGLDVQTTGAEATQSVSTQISPTNADTFIYAPTLLPDGGSCIEVSTVYSIYAHEVAAWDWCSQSSNFVAAVPIDSTFMATYTSSGHYQVRIRKTQATTNTWTAFLFNYKTKTWQTLFSQSGTPAPSNGWDMYEVYSDIAPDGTSYACADLQGKTVDAKAIEIQRKVGGGWTNATPTYATGTAISAEDGFLCPTLSWKFIYPYYRWTVTG